MPGFGRALEDVVTEQSEGDRETGVGPPPLACPRPPRSSSASRLSSNSCLSGWATL